MRNLILLLLAIFAPLLTWGGETIPALNLFVLPKAELKPLGITNAVPHPEMEAALARKDETPEEFSLTKETSLIVTESTVQAFESMNSVPILSAAAPSYELGGAAGWLNDHVWDPVFAPEVIQVGKVKMTGGVIAAVKRKNPFCLLHPLVFAAGW